MRFSEVKETKPAGSCDGGQRKVLRVVGKSGRAKSQSRRCCVG